MSPLPPIPPERLQGDADVHAAYNICLTVERSLQQAVNNGENVGNDIIYIQTLGYLIHFVPTNLGLRVVVNEILLAKSDRALLDIGKMYFNHYIRAFRANKIKRRIPTPCNQSSGSGRPSFDTVEDMVKDTLEDVPKSHSAAKKHALFRDGYRCVVTGDYDTDSVFAVKELEEKNQDK